MGFFQAIKGTIESMFRIGGTSGVNLKHNSGVLEAKNSGDTAFAALRALALQSGAGQNDVPTKEDLEGICANIQYSFNGASAPSPNTNAGKYGICHTTGGSYTAGDVVYDNGTALIKKPFVTSVNALVAVTGTINLIQNGHYSKVGTTFTLTGDGSGSSTGQIQVVKLSYTYSSTNVDSTTVVPAGAAVIRVDNVVSTPFNAGSPTLEVKINGSTPLSVFGTTLSDLKTAEQYTSFADSSVGASNTGAVRATISNGGSTAGAGDIFVYYVTALS